MIIKINNEEHELNFGVRFVRDLDERAGVLMGTNGQQQNFGMALTKVLPGLKTYDAAVLADVIYCALHADKKRPSIDEIYDYIDNPDTDIAKLFKETQTEIKKSNAVKLAAKNLKA
ncbi:tail assembly chaperone [Limosilactobacillus gastricus]|uniref:tail assembly chaperone n=1 Tax=Limosilactobacillus gastricus TaxID=227942 RepID=UPI0002E4A3D2|nr:tail assembly chaperone [Limosilactobacillus gastricus]